MKKGLKIISVFLIFTFVLTTLSVNYPTNAQDNYGGISPQECKGLDITNASDLVAMNYSISHSITVDDTQTNSVIYNNLEILRKNPEKPQWGPLKAYHYWGEPELGYYKSDNKHAIKTHIEQFIDADIDIIIVDNTNAVKMWTTMEMYDDGTSKYDRGVVIPSTILLDTLLEMRSEGKKTPYVMFWSCSGTLKNNIPSFVGLDTYERFYKPGKYDSLFVYLEGKPLMLVTEAKPPELDEYFTVIKMWGLQPQLGQREWSFLQPYPQQFGRNKKVIEQIGVSTAVQRTYATRQSAEGKNGGKTYQKQWERAFEVRAKLVTICWWNEWVSRYNMTESGEEFFNDTFDMDFNMDIEPMKGGHGDLYYQWTKKYIEAYKNHQPCPVFSSASVDSWQGWNPIYKRIGDGLPEDLPAETALGLQKSNMIIGEKKKAYRGNDYLNVMFDTGTSQRFSDGSISVRSYIDPTNFTLTPFLKAAVRFDAAPEADSTTEYAVTLRIYSDSSCKEYTEQSIKAQPDRWITIVLDLRNWKHKRSTSGPVEIIFKPTGKGTAWWYGNLGIDWVVRSRNAKTYMSRQGVHNGGSDRTEVVLGDFETIVK